MTPTQRLISWSCLCLLYVAWLCLSGATWQKQLEGKCAADPRASDQLDNDNNGLVDDCSSAADPFAPSGSGYLALAQDFQVIAPAQLANDATVTGGKVLTFGGNSPATSGLATVCGTFTAGDYKLWNFIKVSGQTVNAVWPILDATAHPTWDNSFVYLPIGNQTSTAFVWDVVGRIQSNTAFATKQAQTSPQIYALTAGRHCFSFWGQTGVQIAGLGLTVGTAVSDFLPTTPAVISALSSGTPTQTTATLTWTTDRFADTQVEYGPTTSYGQTSTLDTNKVTAHSVALAGLTPNTLYHWRALSRTGAGLLTTSADQTFTTTALVTTGTVAVSTVGENGLANTAPAVNVQIDALTPVLRTTSASSLSSGSHTVKITDVPGLVPNYGTCTYAEGGSVCTVSSFPSTPTCANGTCSASVTVSAGTVSRIVFQSIGGPREGYAVGQTGGKNGTVITVNSVNDLMALETTYKTGNVYVTFGTGGNYQLFRNIVVTGANITIDCYTAPGRNITFSRYGFNITNADLSNAIHDTRDVIIQGCHFDKANFQASTSDHDTRLIYMDADLPVAVYRERRVARDTSFVERILLQHNSFLGCLEECVFAGSNTRTLTVADNLFAPPFSLDSALALTDGTQGAGVYRNVILGPLGLVHVFDPSGLTTPTLATHVAGNLWGLQQDINQNFNTVNLRAGVDVLLENNTFLPIGNNPTLGTINLAGNATVPGNLYKLNNTLIVCNPTANWKAGNTAEPARCPSTQAIDSVGDILLRNNSYQIGACSTCPTATLNPDQLSTTATAPTVPSVTLENTANSACHAFQLAGPSPRSTAETTYLAQLVISNCTGSAQPAFDFTIATNNSSLPVAQGASAPLTVNLGLFSGATQTVTLSISGLPANVTSNFSTSNCTPSCSSTLTINAGATAVIGNYTVTVTGTAGSVVHSTTFNLVINAAPAAVPVGFWKMDAGSGTTLADSSASNNPLTMFNSPTWVTNPTAVSFDGVNDVAYTTTFSNTIPAAKTISAWVSWQGGGVNEGWVAGNPNEGWLFIQKSSGKVCYMDNATLTSPVCSTLTLTQNTWTFIAAKTNGGTPQTVNIWVGGTSIQGTIPTAPPKSANVQFGIGGLALAPTARPVNAQIRYVRLYLSAIADSVLTTLSQELLGQVQTVDTPLISPAGGTFTTGSTQNVSLVTQLTGTTIYYTQDGSTPTTGSTVYSTPIPVTTTRTIKAFATKTGYQNSGVASATFTFTVAAACDTAGLQVPCPSGFLRTIVVDSAGSNSPPLAYTTLQPALDNSLPGDDILIKKNASGYATTNTDPSFCGKAFICISKNGTQTNPIRIRSFDPNNKAKIVDDLWVGYDAPVIGGQWTIIEDLEFQSNNIEGAGIRSFAQHVVIRRINTHDNLYQGIWLDNSHTLVEDSIFKNNGSQGNGIGCMGDWDSNPSTPNQWDPSHCHGIYGGSPPLQVVDGVNRPDLCEAPHDVVIRRNWFENNGGAGFQQYTNPGRCSDPVWGRRAHSYLIENNILRNNGQDFLIIGMTDSTIRNNTIVKDQIVDQNGTPLEFTEWEDVGATLAIYHNLYVSPFDVTIPPDNVSFFLHNFQKFPDRVIDFDWNMYFIFLPNSRFRGNFDNTVFKNQRMDPTWKNVGKDRSGTILSHTQGPAFVNQATGDFHLTAGSLARNSPFMDLRTAFCPAHDFDQQPRSDGKCDMGAYEFH